MNWRSAPAGWGYAAGRVSCGIATRTASLENPIRGLVWESAGELSGTTCGTTRGSTILSYVSSRRIQGRAAAAFRTGLVNSAALDAAGAAWTICGRGTGKSFGVKAK